MAVSSRAESVVRSGTGIALVAALCVTPMLAGQPGGDARNDRSGCNRSPTTRPRSRPGPERRSTTRAATPDQQRRIFAKVNKTIDAVPRGGTIRVAVFSFTEKRTADALLRARARGVRVRIIFDDHKIYEQESRLRRALGKNPKARSFVLYCSHACRGKGGDMHNKIFMFSQRRSCSQRQHGGLEQHDEPQRRGSVGRRLHDREQPRDVLDVPDSVRPAEGRSGEPASRQHEHLLPSATRAVHRLVLPGPRGEPCERPADGRRSRGCRATERPGGPASRVTPWSGS